MEYVKEKIKLYPRKLANGREAWYYRVYTSEGKRLRFSSNYLVKRNSKGEISQKHLKEVKQTIESDIQKGLLPTDKRVITTFSEFAEGFWDWDNSPYIKRIRARKDLSLDYVQNQQRNTSKHLIPYFGKKKISLITEDDIFAWQHTFKEKNLTNKTANNNLNTLKVMLKEATRIKLIIENPAKNVTPLKKETVERGVLNPTEVKELFSSQKRTAIWGNDPLNFIGNYLAAATGARQGEILGLKEKNCHPEFLHIENSFSKVQGLKSTKTGVKRDIPISHQIYTTLEPLFKNDPESYLFSFNGNTPIEGKRLTKGLYKALGKIGITDEERRKRNITFHSWRHFFNTVLRRYNFADSKVQRITGHRTQEMTENYTHWERSDLEEITRIQDNLFN